MSATPHGNWPPSPPSSAGPPVPPAPAGLGVGWGPVPGYGHPWAAYPAPWAAGPRVCAPWTGFLAALAAGGGIIGCLLPWAGALDGLVVVMGWQTTAGVISLGLDGFALLLGVVMAARRGRLWAPILGFLAAVATSLLLLANLYYLRANPQLDDGLGLSTEITVEPGMWAAPAANLALALFFVLGMFVRRRR